MIDVPPLSCRSCGSPLTETFCDLGSSPLSNAFVSAAALRSMEPFYPLCAYVCTGCWLVQLEVFETPERIFHDYHYFSSYSDSWLQHAERYTEAMMSRFGIGPASQVVEIASNDGYLLQYFRRAGVPVLGVEPAANVAAVAEQAGIPTITDFFGARLAARLRDEGTAADLLLGNNVLAHVPDLNDFVAGLKIALAPDGLITLEFPHLLQLIAGNQFDTIYHEHVSYLSLLALERILVRHGLELFDLEELPTHGGSLRVYIAHAGHERVQPSTRLMAVREGEIDAGLDTIDAYRAFEPRVRKLKRDLLAFLIAARREGKSVAGYGAPAKGNTLLNYCGIRSDLLDFTVDRSPHKQGKYLPGTRVPIRPPAEIARTRPDFVLILPWNLKDEIMTQMEEIRVWGGRFVVAIPEVEVIP